ncbi:PREDICTED: zinc transporter 1 isoform X2 [Nicrophorus vespilloides]|nr:PREDICTED: zinc transporter 1 isoform X2 [Nicrophorus vespilloides]XP_017781075.1 PREDICTED: zinc transporter 1 isoform X2 [Nicrophorus vespilloides]XP_017781076.1 PREDICTED: zinc transporter 1 isoform X2 [Nicrophorus vespilloides]
MPAKKCWGNDEPIQLYVVLTLTIIYFICELVLSHVTHALALLMDSYHMLCNIMALAGCIITIKHGKNKNSTECKEPSSTTSSVGDLPAMEVNCQDSKKQIDRTKSSAQKEKKLKNTFGWARSDVIAMLICCVFLASLSFSILVEALQTLFHIDHQHEVHHPIIMICFGALGLLLNGICYLLIGGYTFHQGSFLFVTESGDVILNRVVTNESVSRGERRLSRTKNMPVPVGVNPPTRQRQGFLEMVRDIIGCIFVIITGLATYFSEQSVAKYVDPLLSITSAVVLMWLSYPYMKESCLILLQTIPDTINIDSMKTQLIQHFPDIVNVHDLHIWQLTASKVISTAHIIFQNPKVYAKIMDDVKEFFLDHGITQVTIQPEFYTKCSSVESLNSVNKHPLCLVKCQDEACVNQHCCPTPNLQMISSKSREDLIAEVEVVCEPTTVEENQAV